MTFKLYKGKIRLGGSVLNEVVKDDLTAPEIAILRAFHGSDAVVDLRKVSDRAMTSSSEDDDDERERTSADERRRLYAIYANPDGNTTESHAKKMRVIRDLFGHDRLPLPEGLEDLAVDSEEGDAVEFQAPPAPKSVPTRKVVQNPFA